MHSFQFAYIGSPKTNQTFEISNIDPIINYTLPDTPTLVWKTLEALGRRCVKNSGSFSADLRFFTPRPENSRPGIIPVRELIFALRFYDRISDSP